MRGRDIALDNGQIRFVHLELIINIIYVIRNNIDMHIRMFIAVFGEQKRHDIVLGGRRDGQRQAFYLTADIA